MLPKIMGILNVTPDSFSDGGHHNEVGAAIAKAMQLVEQGADIIDVGGESTRPGATPVPLDEEIRRTAPVVEALAKAGVRVSIDTMKAGVMQAAVDAGATMLNDVSALVADPDSLRVAANCKADVVLMHMRGNPQNMQSMANYTDTTSDVLAALQQRIQAALAAGIDKSRLIVDPGIGFGKKMEHNLEVLRNLECFHDLGLPVMLAASRKSVIPDVTGPCAVDQRLGGSLAMALRGAEAGVDWVRVHDVAQTRQALLMWQAMRAG